MVFSCQGSLVLLPFPLSLLQAHFFCMQITFFLFLLHSYIFRIVWEPKLRNSDLNRALKHYSQPVRQWFSWEKLFRRKCWNPVSPFIFAQEDIYRYSNYSQLRTLKQERRALSAISIKNLANKPSANYYLRNSFTSREKRHFIVKSSFHEH